MKQITIDGVTYNLIPVQDDKDFVCTLDGFNYYLGPEADAMMNFEDAVTWCKSLGDGYELPNRLVLLACYEDEAIRNKFKIDDYYWSSTEFSATFAWGQYFDDGDQNGVSKLNIYHVRAVRKVAV